MKPSPRDSAATRRLLTLLRDKATGRLEVGAGGSTLSVYVLHGEVVAAVSAEDERQLIHLLRLRQELPDDQLAPMEVRADAGESVFGDLLTANPPSLEDLLAQRFRQNLCDYVASLEKPSFAPQKGVFVDNIQMGHESRPLVEACCAFATKAQRIDPDQLLIRGPSTPRTESGAIVASLLNHEPQSVYALTLRIPLEPTAARCLLVDLVTEGVAQVPGAVVEPKGAGGKPEDDTRPEDDSRPEDGTTPEDDSRPEDSVPPLDEEEPPTESAIQRPSPAALLADEDIESEEGVVRLLDEPIEQAPPPSAPSSDLPPDDELSEEVPQSIDDEPEPVEEPESIEEEPVDDEPEPIDEPAADELGPEDNEAEDFDVVADESDESQSSGAPRSLAAWLADATHVDDDELDFFSDHDHDRGSAEEGAFSTESHNLDKVDVTAFDDDEILEAEEAPSAPKFSAPVLGEEALEAKIDVATDMLQKIVAAFDRADGSGAGQAAMQLLVDGAPPKFVPLLTGLTLGDDGSLPTGRVLANLYSRPATEHRKLINDGLLNLMERALSKAADELPDELFDSVYEGVAGYKQRLGL